MSLAVFPSGLLINADNFNPQYLTGGAACAAWQVNSFVHHVDMVVWDGDVLVNVVAEWIPWEANTCWHGNWQNDFCGKSILDGVVPVLIFCGKSTLVDMLTDRMTFVRSQYLVAWEVKFCWRVIKHVLWKIGLTNKTTSFARYSCVCLFAPRCDSPTPRTHTHKHLNQSIDRAIASLLCYFFLSPCLSFAFSLFVHSFSPLFPVFLINACQSMHC